MSEHTLRRMADLERRSEHDRVLSGTSDPVIAARAATAAGQSMANNTLTIVDYGAVIFDTHGRITTGAAWKFTASLTGYYRVHASILFAATTNWAAGYPGHIILYQNNVLASQLDRKDNFSGATGQYMMLHGSDVLYLLAGDFIDVRVLQTNGAALALFASAEYNYISIVRV